MEPSLSLLWQTALSAVLVLGVFALFVWRFAQGPWGLLTCLATLAADQATKYLFLAVLPERGMPLAGGLSLRLFTNPFQGFGSTFPELLLASLAGISLALVLYTRLERLQYRMSTWTDVAVGLTMGGIAGIMVDRLRLGGVIDFLEYRSYVYNLADLCVFAAMAMIAARSAMLLYQYRRHELAESLQ